MQLAQPCVLAAPRVVHRHRALGERVNVIALSALRIAVIPDRQGRHGLLDPFAQMVGGLAFAMTFGSQLKPPQRFDVEREQIGLRRVIDAHADGPVLIGSVPRLVVVRPLRDMIDEEAAVFNIAVNLLGVRRPAPDILAVFAPEPGQRANARTAFVAGDVVGVVFVFLAAVLVHETRQTELRPQIAER